MKNPYVPMGCDQQGRVPDRAEAPEPAEAVTEIGFVDEPPEQDIVRVVFVGLLWAIALVGVAWTVAWAIAALIARAA